MNVLYFSDGGLISTAVLEFSLGAFYIFDLDFCLLVFLTFLSCTCSKFCSGLLMSIFLSSFVESRVIIHQG